MATWPGRFPGRAIALVGGVFTAAYLSSVALFPKTDGRIVVGDAVHYYVYLRSAVFDRDLAFKNEYVRLYGLHGGEPDLEWLETPTSTGHTRNLMSVGPALVWLPLYAVATVALWAGHAVNLWPAPDGYERVLQASTGVSGITAATLGVWFAFVATRRLYGVRAAIWSVLALWLSSSALYYSLVSPTYSHAASMLACSAFVAAWVTGLGTHSVRRFAVLGLLGGCAAMVRWQDAIYLLLPALEIASHAAALRKTRDGRQAIRLAALWLFVCVGAAALAFLPQMVAWTILYGSPLLVPQGGSFMKWTSPSLWATLFSTYRGLVTWTPVVGLALAGLALVPGRDRLVGWGMLVVFALSWYVNASVADWWGGEAFGARRFVSCLPVFAIGLAALARWLDWNPPRLALATGALAIHTSLLLLQYQVFLKGLRFLAPYPDTAYGLWVGRFVVPFQLACWWWSTP